MDQNNPGDAQFFGRHDDDDDDDDVVCQIQITTTTTWVTTIAILQVSYDAVVTPWGSWSACIIAGHP